MGWPTTANPRTEMVTLRLTVDEAVELDRFAVENGYSRSEAVRRAVTRMTAAEAKKRRRAQQGTGQDD